MTSSAEWMRMAEENEKDAQRFKELAEQARRLGDKENEYQWDRQYSDACRIARQNKELARGY